MEFLSVVLLIGVSLAAIFTLLLIHGWIRGSMLKAPLEIGAEIRRVRELQTPDRSWPSYILELTYSAGGKKFRRRVVLTDEDFREQFPDLPLDTQLDGSATVPLLVDFGNPRSSILDPRWLGSDR